MYFLSSSHTGNELHFPTCSSEFKELEIVQEEAEREVLLDLICHLSFDQFWWVGVISLFSRHNKWHKKQHVDVESNQFFIKVELV